MRAASRMLTTAFCLIMTAAAAAFAQGATIPVAPFNSVHLEHGGHVIIRSGAAHRVTFIKGSADYSRVSVTDAGELVIDRCRSKCPKGYDLEVEVVAPTLDRISVAQGGTIRVREDFPRRAQLALEVNNGGSIDARTIPADRVMASIEHGGGIFTVPGASLVARVIQGGNIMYWGDAQVRSSVQHGGIVVKGKPGELLLPPSEIGFSNFSAKRH